MPDALISHSTPRSQSYSIIMLLFATICCPHYLYSHSLSPSLSICLQFVDIGVVTSIESNHKNIEFARKGQEICIKIEPIPGESPKMYGRHFEADDFLVSKVSSEGSPTLSIRCNFPAAQHIIFYSMNFAVELPRALSSSSSILPCLYPL